MAGRPAAFFDLDRTLIPHNSGSSWIRREVRAGRLSRRQATEAALWFAAYRLGLLDVEPAFHKGAAAIRGQSEAEMADRTRTWYLEEVRATLLPAGLRTVDEHRSQGHALVLLTSSSPYVSRLVAEDLALDDYLCTRFAVDPDGRFSGDVVQPICYGEGKVRHATAWATGRAVDLAASYFYTDSHTDLPMLLAVGEPRVVNPDHRLRREARRRGWPVLDWVKDSAVVPPPALTS